MPGGSEAEPTRPYSRVEAVVFGVGVFIIAAAASATWYGGYEVYDAIANQSGSGRAGTLRFERVALGMNIAMAAFIVAFAGVMVVFGTLLATRRARRPPAGSPNRP
jgi:hypothetical protein